MRKPETFLSRTLSRFGFKPKTNSAKRFGEATRLRTFEPLERRQLLSVVTWTGLGSDNNWGTAANWSTNAAPTAGDDLVFSGSTRTATQNNLAAGTSFHSIEFKNNSFTLSGNSLTLTSGVIIDSGVTGTNVTLAGIGLSGNVTFNVATTSVTVSSAISGAGRLVKSGSGTLILTGADTYTGGTTISAGALQLGNGGATGSIVGDVVNSGQLIVNRTGSLTLSGVVSGAGSLSKLGSGTLILSGNNTYTGGTSISAGKLQLGSSAALGYNNLTINGGTVDLAGHGLEVRHLNGSAGGLITTNAGSATLQIDDGGTYAGRILDGTGSIGLRVEGWGDQLTLSGENTFFTGGTIIDGATVKADHNWALGYGNVTMIGGVLDLGGHDVFVFHVYGDSNSSITDTVGAGILRVSAGGNFQGDIFDSGGSVAIYAWGWGDALILGGYNSYTGGTTIDHGVVICEGENSLGYGNLTMSGGSLDLNGHYVEVTRINGDSGSLITSSAGSGMLQIDFGGSFSGTIADGANGETAIRYCGFYDYAPGRLTLSGDNSYSGGTETYDGTLILGGNTALGTGAVIINGTLDLAGYSPTIGGLNGGGHIGNGSSTTNSTLTVSGGGNFSGVISDVLDIGSKTVSLAVSGGTLILTGANTYTGGTVITGGTLQIGDGGASGSIVGNITDNGQLVFNRSDDWTYSGTLAGSGGMTKNGAGTLTLTGDNFYLHGGTTVNAGTLKTGHNWALGYGNVTVLGGTLDLYGHDVFALHLYGDAGSLITNTDGAASLAISEGGNFAGRIADDQLGHSISLWVMRWGDSLVLSGDNNYSGGTFVDGATVQLGSDTALGLGDLSMAGGTVSLNGHDLEVRHLTSDDSSSLIWNDGGFATLQVDEGGVFRGQIRDAGALNLAVRSMGWGDTFSLSGANWYTGGTEVEGGELKIDSETALGYGNLTLDSGVVDMNGYETYVYGGLYGLADGRIINSGASAGLVVYQGGWYAGHIYDDGVNQITLKLYGGDLTLSGANTYSGGTWDYTYGTLKVGDNAALGVGPVDVYATLDLGGYSLTINGLTGGGTVGNSSTTSNSTLTVNGDCTFSGSINDALESGTKKVAFVSAGGTVVLSGANTYSGGTTISGGTLQIGAGGAGGSVVGNIVDNSSLVVDISGTLTLSGVISGSGSLTKAGSGTLILTGANTYSGGTTITGGTLQIGSGGTTGSLVGAVVDNGTLAVNRSNAWTLSGVVSGSGGLLKAGTGTLTVSGANTYTGTTTVQQGTLSVATIAVSGGASNIGNSTSAVILGDTSGHTGILSYTGANGTFTRGLNILSGGGEFDVAVSGRTETIATGNISASGAFTIGGLGNTAISSVIFGVGSLTKIGAGTLTLSGANAYTGVTRIQQGTLSASSIVVSGGASNLGNATSAVVLGDGSGHKGILSYTGTSATYIRGFNVLSGGGEVDVTTSTQTLTIATAGITSINSFAVGGLGSTVISSVISGAGKVVKTLNGKLTLSAANTFTGGTQIDSGTIIVGNVTALNKGDLTMNGGTLDMNGYNVEIKRISGAGGSITDNARNASSTLQINNGGWYQGTLVDGTSRVSLRVTGYGNELMFLGSNFFTGGAEIIDATVRTGDDMSLGYGNVTLTRGTIDLNGYDLTIYGALGGDSDSVIWSTGRDAKLSLNGGSYAGQLIDYDNYRLAVDVLANVTLTGGNAYSGGTTIEVGVTLNVGSENALGCGNLQVDGILNLSGHSTTVVGLAGSGLITNLNASEEGVLVVTGGGSFSGDISDPLHTSSLGVGLTVSGCWLSLTGGTAYTGLTTICNEGTLEISAPLITRAIINDGELLVTASNSFALSNTISGSGTLYKAGSGNLTLTGNNWFITGEVCVAEGSLKVGRVSALGSGNLSVLGGATLDLNGIDNSILPLSGVWLAGGSILNGTLAVNSAMYVSEGLITANLTGSADLIKNTSGTLILTGTNTYTGVTNAADGTLYFVNPQSCPSGTTIIGSGTVIRPQTLYWNGGDGDWNAANAWHYADGTLTSWVVDSAAYFSGGGSITITGSVDATSVHFASGNYTISGGQISIPHFTVFDVAACSVAVSSDVVGVGVLDKLGSGTLSLVGAPVFTGSVWGEAGTCVVEFSSWSATQPTLLQIGSGVITGLGSLDWQDSALYQEALSYNSDKLINRTEMISILNSVVARGAVTAAEFHDLQLLVSVPQIIDMPDYVYVLARDVILGNTANAHYQGATLGNLAVGSSATQLTSLINKWFLGSDHPECPGWYRTFSGTLADSDGLFSWDDMYQGYIGDCWLIASLGALANASQSAISNMFVNNGDGTWTVRFYKIGTNQADYVTVDQALPLWTSWGINYGAGWWHGLWIPLIEKAYAQWCETGNANRATVNSYGSLERGWYTEVYCAVTGNWGSNIYDEASMIAALDSGMAVCYGQLNVSLSDYNIVGDHAYPIIGHYYDSTANDERFILKNPWGYNQPTDVLGRDLTYVVAVDPSGTTPAGAALASVSRASASSVALASGSSALAASLAMNAAPGFANSMNSVSTTSSESIFNRIALQPFFDNRREATSLPNEIQARAEAIASLCVDFSTGVNSAGKLPLVGVTEDASSDYVALATATESTDSFADFEIVRHLRANKKVAQLDEAADAVFAEEEMYFLL